MESTESLDQMQAKLLILEMEAHLEIKIWKCKKEIVLEEAIQMQEDRMSLTEIPLNLEEAEENSTNLGGRFHLTPIP